MFEILSNFRSLFDGDLTDEQRKAIKKAFASGLGMLMWRGITLMFLLYAFGAFTLIGMNGFARADAIKKEVEKATAPIAAEQTKQGALLARISQQLTENELRAAAAQIRLLVAKRCLEKTPNERERLNGEIYKIQNAFRSLDSYKPECGDL